MAVNNYVLLVLRNISEEGKRGRLDCIAESL